MLSKIGAACRNEPLGETAAASTVIPSFLIREREKHPVQLENFLTAPVAGARGIETDEEARTRGFRRSEPLREHRPLLRRGEGEWRPLLLETPLGPGPVGQNPTKGADERLSPVQCRYYRSAKPRGHRPSLQRGQGEWRPLLLENSAPWAGARGIKSDEKARIGGLSPVRCRCGSIDRHDGEGRVSGDRCCWRRPRGRGS